jgi:cation transport ATPase
MYLSLGANLGNPQGLARHLIHGTLAMVAGGVILGLGWPILASGWKDLRAGDITLEHAFLIGILGSYGASIHSSVSGDGPIYYEVAVVLIAIYLFGRNVTGRQIRHQANLALAIPGLRETATISTDGIRSELSVREIRTGQLVVLEEGETIPVDGVIAEGRAYVEQQAHTGETYPQPRAPGDRVLAGSVLLDGGLTVRATSDGDAREIDRLMASLAACAAPVKAEALARRILGFFVPTVLGIAILTVIVWTLLGRPAEGWINALTVTVVACPCALGVAIPLAVRRGRMELALLGIIPARAGFLDRLAEIDSVAFDKTGTLSDPRLELAALEVDPDAPPRWIDWVIAIQRKSSHPVARPFWKLTGTGSPPPTDLRVETIPGRGVRALFHDEGRAREILIGNRHLLDDLSISVPPGGTERALHVVMDDRIVATARLEESTRENSSDALAKLLRDGYELSILTGDSTVPDEYRLGSVQVQTGLSSAEKAGWISGRSSSRRILYVGDGLNDCEGFALAHGSIALKSGNAAAQELAGAVICHDDIGVIPTALRQTKALRGRLDGILRFSFLFNATGIGLAACGMLDPVVAAALMFASSIFVISRI